MRGNWWLGLSSVLMRVSNAQDGSLIPNGTFVGTDPPSAPAGCGSLQPAETPGLVPTLPDRKKHKQRGARPRPPTFAPPVLPGHFEAGPPPPGRAYEPGEKDRRPSRLAPTCPCGPDIA